MPNPNPPIANLKPFKPGENGNKNGRPRAGASVREYINILADQGVTEDDLRAICRDRKNEWQKRAAAERMLRTLEAPDLADFDGVVNGTMTVAEARAAGLNTEVLKKVKTRTRKIPNGDNPPIIEVEREVELFDRAGEDFYKIIEHTDGKPSQHLELSGPGGGPIVQQGDFDLSMCSFEELEYLHNLRDELVKRAALAAGDSPQTELQNG